MGTGIKKDCVILILSFGAPCSSQKKRNKKKKEKKEKKQKSKRAKEQKSKEDKEERSGYACGKR